MERHPVITAAAVFVALVVLTRLVTKPAGSNPISVALGSPSGAVPYAIGASVMGPIGGVF